MIWIWVSAGLLIVASVQAKLIGIVGTAALSGPICAIPTHG